MSKIQQYGSHGLPKYVEDKVSVVDAKIASLSLYNENNPRLIDQSVKQWSELLQNILLKAQIKLSLKPKDPNENALVMECINQDLGSKFPSLTRLEVYAALDAGLDGKYLKEGESNVFFNPSNLVQWIRAWIEDVKKPVMKKVLEAQHNCELERAVPNPYNSIAYGWNLLYDVVKKGFTDKSPYRDILGCRIIYRFLTEIGFMPRVNDDFDKLSEAASINLKEALQMMDRSRIKEARSIGESLDLINPNQAILSIAERKSVTDQIDKMKAMSVETCVEYMIMIEGFMDEYIAANNLKPDPQSDKQVHTENPEGNEEVRNIS